nr:hypothetical protein GCM10020092_106530 [Actinoplanes digitatis]
MRRLTALLAAATVLLPVTLVSAPASAAAATAYLTVITYDRSGAKLKAPLHLINLDNGQEYQGTSLKAKKLKKKGKYAVLTDVYSTKDGTDTLGARVLKVSGRTTTTIDARRGKPVKLALDKNPGDAFRQELRAQICADSDSSGTEIGAWNVPGKLFVIPNSSKRLQFAYSSNWSDGAMGNLWMVAGATKSAVPAGVSRTYRAASLATVTGWVKRGPARQRQRQPEPGGEHPVPRRVRRLRLLRDQPGRRQDPCQSGQMAPGGRLVGCGERRQQRPHGLRRPQSHPGRGQVVLPQLLQRRLGTRPEPAPHVLQHAEVRHVADVHRPLVRRVLRGQRAITGDAVQQREQGAQGAVAHGLGG